MHAKRLANQQDLIKHVALERKTTQAHIHTHTHTHTRTHAHTHTHSRTCSLWVRFCDSKFCKCLLLYAKMTICSHLQTFGTLSSEWSAIVATIHIQTCNKTKKQPRSFCEHPLFKVCFDGINVLTSLQAETKLACQYHQGCSTGEPRMPDCYVSTSQARV